MKKQNSNICNNRHNEQSRPETKKSPRNDQPKKNKKKTLLWEWGWGGVTDLN